MGEESLCRLCAETKPYLDLLNIKDDYWITQELDKKVTQLFQIKILPTDKLPKSVCCKCCEQVNFAWEFHERIQKAQERLRSALLAEESGADYDSDLPLAPLLIKSEKQNLPEFVECIYEDSKGNMTKEEDISDMESGAVESDEKKRKGSVRHKEAQKRRPGRPKGRKTRKKSSNESEDQVTENDDDISVLSGASEAEQNEDGSLILQNLLEGWDSYPWTCVDCNEKQTSIIELRNHHQNMHNQLPKYVCVDCPKIYTKYYGFITHVRCHRYHLRFCCDVCNKFFANRKLLETHRTSHFDARPYLCTTCGKGFRMQSALYVHARSHLPVEVKNKYPCDQCPKRFGTKPNLMAHKRIHTGIRDYTCDQCGKSFIQKGNLENHLLTHIAARPYSCEVCGKAFKTLMRLKKHGTVHSGLKPYKCEICEREFRERGTLKEHLRIHTGAMPFTCEFCGKCFRFKGVLTTHRRQHTGERPYSCQECQHHFTNWPNYNKHMKRRHGINTSVTTRKPQTIPPTGMPHRNPPGTVLAPSATQLVIIQNPNPMPNVGTTAYMEQEPTTFDAATQNLNRIAASPVTAITAVNVQPQNYYMLHGLYNIQGMNAELMQHAPQ